MAETSRRAARGVTPSLSRWWSSRARRPERAGRKNHHPEHGWLAFVFPQEHAALLGTTLVKHSGLCEYFAGTLPPSTGTVN